jgi:hypothetical protein
LFKPHFELEDWEKFFIHLDLLILRIMCCVNTRQE